MRLTLALVALLASTGIAAADDQDKNAARVHYKRGTTFYDLGRYHDAAKEYEQAFEAKDDPALLFNIAQAYRLAHEYPEAVRAYRAFLRRVPDAPNAAAVEARIKEMQDLMDRQQTTEQKPPIGLSPETRPPETPPPPAQTAQPVTTTTSAAPPRTPVYKKWWLWTTIGGVVVAGAVVGIAVGVTANADPFNPTLGKVGPGLTVVLP